LSLIRGFWQDLEIVASSPDVARRLHRVLGGIMADLSVESASLLSASAALGHVPDPVPKAEAAFKAQRHDLKAFGALGSLMHAQSQVGKAMDDLAEASASLRSEWANESDILSTIGQAFADLDAALGRDVPQLRGVTAAR